VCDLWIGGEKGKHVDSLATPSAMMVPHLHFGFVDEWVMGINRNKEIRERRERGEFFAGPYAFAFSFLMGNCPWSEGNGMVRCCRLAIGLGMK
jgi:hypothetical protein